MENIYDIGKIYDFNQDVRSIFSNAKTKIFLIDPYANEDIFCSYVNEIPDQIEIMILTTKKHTAEFLNHAKNLKKNPIILKLN